ncbi:hypothetical protein CLV58_14610, partial [Spirosoma oryzae]
TLHGRSVWGWFEFGDPKLPLQGYSFSFVMSLGILLLAQKKLIRKKQRSQYWINPSAFRPATITL